MASTNTVGTTIKKEHTDGARAYSSQQLVHSSSRVLHKEVKRELNPAPSPPTVQVCPINVVQGDSILVKLKYKEGQEYNYLIDGGHAKHLSNIINCMDEYGVKTECGIQLDGIIVTHPDVDHLNGITKLLERHRQMFLNNYDVIITEAFYWKSKQDVCTRFLKLMDKIYHNRDISGAATCLRPGLNCYFRKETGCLLRCTARDDKVRHTQPSETFIKEAPKYVDANDTSILTVINQSERKCDAVLTGDSTAGEILPLVEGKEIGIFQVPHHGSCLNSRLKDKSKLLEYSRQCNLSILHNCNNEVKEILLFYSTFKAQCYLISAGGTESYKHPHPPVLQGIILANSLRHWECVIVLTNSRGLNSEKLKQLHVHQLAPQWTRYVKIYHLDDVFFTEQHHTSLCPERCISDVRTNTVEWTPEGYINRTKIVLPVKLTISNHRPLEKNRFTEQSTVEITVQSVQGTLKFSAHIICVPLPHNPRSGDSINCCYVIEESIASGVDLSKALFLLNGDKTAPLSRAKQYILLQYVNNEWQKKELPVTMQDVSPQTSPYPIPYDRINPLWPAQDISVPDSSPQNSPSCIQQSHYDIGSLQLDGKRAIATTNVANHHTGVHQQGGKAEQQSTNKSSPIQYPHQCNDNRQITRTANLSSPEDLKIVASQGAEVSPTKGCGCRTGCNTMKCGCKKRESYCGPICQCGSECKNNHQYALHSSVAGQLRVTPDKAKRVEVKSESPTKGCGCIKGCTTNRCGCKKKGLTCGSSCRCTSCKNK